MSTFGNIALYHSEPDMIQNYIDGGYFQMGPTDGTADSITVLLSVLDETESLAKCALYNSDNILVINGQTEELALSIMSETSKTFKFVGTKPILEANAWYYIVVWARSDYGDAVWSWYQEETGDGAFYLNEIYAEIFPNEYGAREELGRSSLYAIYCTYTEKGLEPEISVECDNPGRIAISSSPLGMVEINADTDNTYGNELRLKRTCS